MAQDASNPDAAVDGEAAAAIFDANKLLLAVVVNNLAARFAVSPGALTPAQVAAEQTRIYSIFKALP